MRLQRRPLRAHLATMRTVHAACLEVHDFDVAPHKGVLALVPAHVLPRPCISGVHPSHPASRGPGGGFVPGAPQK